MLEPRLPGPATSLNAFDESRRSGRGFAHWTALLLAWAWFAGPLIWRQGSLFFIDTGMQDVPLRLWAARWLRQGVFPHWVAELGCGWPLHAEGQTGVLYPGFLVYVLSPTPQTHDCFMALHYLLSAVGMCWFLKRKVAGPAAAMGGIVYMACPLLAATHVVPGTLTVASWFPIALSLVERCVDGNRRALWWAAAVHACMLLAGFPQAALVLISVVGLYHLSRTLARRARPEPLDLAVVYVLPVLVGAAQFLPTYRLLHHSTREAHYPWEQFLWTTVPWNGLLTGGVPPLKTEVSVLATSAQALALLAQFLLMVTCWFSPGRRWTKIGYTAILLAGIAIATGTPLLRIVHWLPVYSWFRWHAVYLLPGNWAAAALAAYGADWLAKSVARLLATRKRLPELPRWPLPAICYTLGLLAVSRTMGVYLSRDDFYHLPPRWLLAEAHVDRHFRLWPVHEAHEKGAISGHFSEADMALGARTLAANYNLLFDVAVARIIHQHDTVAPREATEFLLAREQFLPGLASRLRYAGVTHISTYDSPTESLVSFVRLVHASPQEHVWLYRLDQAMPRAWLVGQTITLERQARVDRMGDSRTRPAHLALLEQSRSERSNDEPWWPSSIETRQPRPDRLLLDASSAGGGLLVVADAFDSNFATWVDGQPALCDRANHAFRAVDLSSGTHRVFMCYWPREFLLGWLISIPAATLLAAGLVVTRRETRPHQT